MFADVHCHCLPELDDGPGAMPQAVALCRALARDHIRLVVATPHELGRFGLSVDPKRIRIAVQQLNEELKSQGIELTVSPGAEVRLDERIGTLLATDDVLTLADLHRHVLLELPDDAFIDIEPLIGQLACQGVSIVIAHPERNAPLVNHRHILSRWLDQGVTLQVTAGSLVGWFGPRAGQMAWWFVTEGWAAMVATDAHDCEERDPGLAVAFEMVASRCGDRVATQLCVENPWRIVKGGNPVPVLAESMQDVR